MSDGRRMFQVPPLSRLCLPTSTCRHKGRDGKPLCPRWRNAAACTCRVCRKPIGFAVLIVDDPQPDLFEPERRAVLHLECDELERGRVPRRRTRIEDERERRARELARQAKHPPTSPSIILCSRRRS
jgi:hypothetical protein